MNINEFSSQFDILYDNISTNGAPGIDEYEKSVYLTKAQLEIIKQYNSDLNKYKKSFDQSEKRRIDLKELIRDYKSTNKIQNSENIDTENFSNFFEIPEEVFLIKFERIFKSFENCSDKRIDVVPVTLDEYNEKIDNPFREPYEGEAWRIDYTKIDTIDNENINVVEIISNIDPDKYHLRYIKYPKPIILSSLLDFYGDGEDLTIEGISSISECELNKEIHQEILDRAVELAFRDYRTRSLESKIELNKRNN